MSNDSMETVGYMWVDMWCMLDWIIGLCHKTAEIHAPGMSCPAGEYTKLDVAVADGDAWSMKKSQPIARPHIRRSNMVKQGRMYSKQNWKWMLARLWKNENLGA